MVFVPLVDELMSPRDEGEVIDVAELGGDFIAEKPTRTSGADGPSLDVLRVGPDEIAECPFVRDLLGSRHDADLVQRPDLRAQSAVDAENFAVDDGAEGHEVKDLAACFPDGSVAVFLHAFFVEAVNLGDLAGFMVAADKGDAVGVFGFEAEEEGQGFEGEIAAVDVVA